MIRLQNIGFIIISLIIFFITFHASNELLDGDITKYKKVYNFFASENDKQQEFFQIENTEDIWGNTTESLRDYYSKYLTSKEFIHYALIYFSSQFISYELYLSLLNFLFVFLILKIFSRYGVNFYISILLLFTNYYFIQFYFSLERLKIGIIIFLFFLYLSIVNKNKALIYISSGFILSAFAHLQMILIFLSTISFWVFREVFQFIFHKKLNIFLLLISIFTILFFITFFSQIYHKILAVRNSVDIINFNIYLIVFVKFFIFYVLTIFYSKKNNLFFISSFFLVLYLFSIIIGGNRLVIVAFFFFLIFALKANRGFNLGIIATSFYFLVKSYYSFYSYYYCHSLNYTHTECIYMQQNEYTQMILEYPELRDRIFINPENPNLEEGILKSWGEIYLIKKELEKNK